MPKERKQKLAEALAEETAGIDVDALVGPPRKIPDTLTAEEQRSRDQAFVQRFTAMKAQPASAHDTVLDGDTASNPAAANSGDTVSESGTVSIPPTGAEADAVSHTDTVIEARRKAHLL